MNNSENLEFICPICSNPVEESMLDGTKINRELLGELERHLQSGTLKQIFRLADIILSQTQQDKILEELKQKESLNSTQEMISKMMDIFHQNQEKMLGEFLTADESKKKQLILEHANLQDRLMQEYKRDVFEKMDQIKKTEESRSREYNELTTSIREIHTRVFGPAVGMIGEVVTILDLKRFCPTDNFSELRANKHGTDIIGEVIEYGKKCGVITISVKYQSKWDSDFITQLTKNLAQDNSRWGVLVTKVFPREALNDKMWTTHDSQGKLIFMVKPEYAPLAYYASRQIAVHWASIESIIKSTESARKEEDNIKRRVMDWITGEKFQKTLADISQAMRNNKEVDEGLISIQGYLAERIKKMRNCGDEIHYFLEAVNFSLMDLKQLLQNPDTPTQSILTPYPKDRSELGGGS